MVAPSPSVLGARLADATIAGSCEAGAVQAEWRRVAVYVVCRDQAARLLLTRFVDAGTPDSGKWTMPGGAMEWGESAEETAHRELAEETGLAATLGPVLGIFSRWYTAQESFRGEPGHAVGIVYQATEVRGELRSTFDDGTTDAVAWFTLDEARSLPHVELVDTVLDLIDAPPRPPGRATPPPDATGSA